MSIFRYFSVGVGMVFPIMSSIKRKAFRGSQVKKNENAMIMTQRNPFG